MVTIKKFISRFSSTILQIERLFHHQKFIASNALSD